MTNNNISPRFGNKIAYVQQNNVILTLTDDAPINQRQITIDKVVPCGDGIAIHCDFNNVFLMPSIDALVDIVDWDWMEGHVS